MQNITLNSSEKAYIRNYFHRFFSTNSPELNQRNMVEIENMVLENSEWIAKIPQESRIQTLCRDYIRFDTESGEFMASGWVVQEDGKGKPFLFISGKGGDDAIKRAEDIAVRDLRMTLRGLLSQKFPTFADWVNFWQPC